MQTTHLQQKAILRRHLASFLRHQKAATAALQSIVEIGLCENEGNPLDSALRGEDVILAYANMTGDLAATIDAASAALDSAGHIV